MNCSGGEMFSSMKRKDKISACYCLKETLLSFKKKYLLESAQRSPDKWRVTKQLINEYSFNRQRTHSQACLHNLTKINTVMNDENNDVTSWNVDVT